MASVLKMPQTDSIAGLTVIVIFSSGHPSAAPARPAVQSVQVRAVRVGFEVLNFGCAKKYPACPRHPSAPPTTPAGKSVQRDSIRVGFEVFNWRGSYGRGRQERQVSNRKFHLAFSRV